MSRSSNLSVIIIEMVGSASLLYYFLQCMFENVCDEKLKINKEGWFCSHLKKKKNTGGKPHAQEPIKHDICDHVLLPADTGPGIREQAKSPLSHSPAEGPWTHHLTS